MSQKCEKCLRINCNCELIAKMKEKGWKVEKGRIFNPDGEKYIVIYADNRLAWNFAVRRYKEIQKFSRKDSLEKPIGRAGRPEFMDKIKRANKEFIEKVEKERKKNETNRTTIRE